MQVNVKMNYIQAYFECEGINPFHAARLFLCSLKTLENLWFSDVFRGIGGDQ